MKNNQKKRVEIFKQIFIMLMLLITIIPSVSNAKELTENKLKHQLKVLIIEINPWLESKQMDAATYLGMEEDVSLCVEELIEDIEYSSHGNIDVSIVKTEWLNEFCTYKDTVNLLDGSTAHRFDEETWLDIMRDGWYGFWDDPRVKDIESFSFDVEYILDKYDLVNRRNNNEFDQVWLVNVDPAMTYESLMVGRTAYFINGYPIIKDCNNFPVMNVSISRRDSNYECFGHMMECIMAQVFKMGYERGFPTEREQDLSYDEMNLWQKFTFNKSTYTNDAEFYGVGNMHFSPNSESDYDWSNSTTVLSTWEDWLYNYPNLKNVTVETNYKAYDEEMSEDICRNHHRWWFYLLPHVEGVTDDGYSNNWWQYFVTMDYVTNVKFPYNSISLKVGDALPEILCKATYQSGKQEIIEVDILGNNFFVENEDILKVKNNKLVAVGEGTTKIYYYLDGVCGYIDVKVSEDIIAWSKASNWAQKELSFSYSEDLIPDVLYSKNYTMQITREEFAAICVMLYENLLGEEIVQTDKVPFTDTTNPDVMKAYSIGIINGTSETKFSPKSLISREQMTTMMARTLAECNVDTTIDENYQYKKFDDHSDISDWALDSVYYMTANNIIKGMDEKNFNAKGNATIEQAVILAGRCVRNIK